MGHSPPLGSQAPHPYLAGCFPATPSLRFSARKKLVSLGSAATSWCGEKTWMSTLGALKICIIYIYTDMKNIYQCRYPWMCVYIYFLFHHSSGKYALKLNVSRWALFRPGSGHAADLHRRKPGHSYRLSWLIMVQSIILYEYYLCISADPGRRKGECVREEEVLPCYYYYYY